MGSKNIDSGSRGRGRPTGFDPDEALEGAMALFWRHGYDGASIDLLSRETRMPRASLYQRYGGKEGLFLAALDHYGKTRMAPVLAALGPDGPLTDDITRFFDAVVDLATQAGAPRGCLISCVLADAAGANPRFRDELDKRFAVLEDRLAARLRVAHPDAAGEQAMVLAAVARGIMLRARAGTSAQKLAQVGRSTAVLFGSASAVPRGQRTSPCS